MTARQLLRSRAISPALDYVLEGQSGGSRHAAPTSKRSKA